MVLVRASSEVRCVVCGVHARCALLHYHQQPAFLCLCRRSPHARAACDPPRLAHTHTHARVQVMDGYEATRELRRAGYTGVIIGVTGNALASDVAAFVKQGVDAVVIKPVDVTKLLDTIEAHI